MSNGSKPSDAPRAPAPSPATDVGIRVQQARASRGLSVRKLAAMCNFSASSISQIERGVVNPRIDTLVSIAASLGMTVSQLMSDDSSLHVPLRAAERRKVINSPLHYEYLLTRRATSNFEIYVMVLQPGGASSPTQVVHGDSQEFCLVQSGIATLEVGTEVYELNEDDSMEHLSSVPHRIVNNSESEVRLLWVISPPSAEDKKACTPVDKEL